MLTFAVVLLLTAGICFALGGAYERSRAEAASIAALHDMYDSALFDADSPLTDYGKGLAAKVALQHGTKIKRPPGVDAHFDDLCKRGLIESTS